MVYFDNALSVIEFLLADGFLGLLWFLLLLFALGFLLGLHLLTLALMVGLLSLVLGKTLDHVLDHLAVTIQVIDRYLNDEILVLRDDIGNDGP